MTWDIHDAGSWGVATTDTPADMAAALALPASWPISTSRCYVRRDQWDALAPAPPVPPVLSSIAPNVGPVAGGTAVTLTGTSLTGCTGAVIGGAAVTAFAVVNDTTATASSPAGTAGARNVQMRSPAGNGNTLSGAFTYE
jgi:hypothetical protein